MLDIRKFTTSTCVLMFRTIDEEDVFQIQIIIHSRNNKTNIKFI